MIVFVDYLYKGVGGVGQLVVNSVFELNKRGLQAKVYASSESYEYKRLKEKNADFIFINSDIVSLKKFACCIDNQDVIFLTHTNNTQLLESIKTINNKIIFYSVHPDTFTGYPPQMKVLFRQGKNAANLISLLLKKKALFFMDEPNVNGARNTGAIINDQDVQYLPVPVISLLNYHRDIHYKKDIYNITYLGRGNEYWKIFPVVKILQDLNKLEVLTQLTIITDENELFNKLISIHVPNNHVYVHYLNGLFGEELEKYLFENSYLHISMGTSALEGAKMGIPTILIDYSKTIFPSNYMYRWLYKSEKYSLADDITNGFSHGGDKLNTIINNLKDKHYYSTISQKCYDYVEDNHSIEGFIDILLRGINNTTMTVNDYCNTGFSFNMKYISPLFTKASKIKRSIIKRK